MSTTRTSIPTPTSFLTPRRVLVMNNMSAILAAISLLLCLIVLGIVALIYSNRKSRKSLDRISFRLLMYSLLSNCVYSVGYIICVKVNPGFWCVAGVWLIQFWLGITNYFILCIAVNLQLVLVHSISSRALEKYYIIGTFALNLAITLPPLIQGKFGWDPVIGVCWLTSTDRNDRLIWQISTQILWIFLAVVITGVSAVITLGYLYKHRFSGKGTLSSSSVAPVRFQSIPMLDTRGSPLKNNVARQASRNLSGDRRFRNAVIRISIYPIVMVIVNIFIIVADLRISTTEGIYTHYDYSLYVAYYAFYGGRGIFYALMALIDPAIIRGLNVWWGLHSKSGQQQEENKLEYSLGGGIINVQAEIIKFMEELGLFPGSGRHGSGITIDTFTSEESAERGGERDMEMGRERGGESEREGERERVPESSRVEERAAREPSYGPAPGQLQMESIQRTVQERAEAMHAAEEQVKRQI